MKKDFLNKIRNILDSGDNDDIKFDQIVNTTKGLDVYGPKTYQDPKGGDEVMDRDIGKIDNASDYPVTVFIRHIEKGIAHYDELDKTVLINDEALCNMKNSLCNKPIYVYHKTSEDDKVENLEKNSHGWIVDSFYNQLDGWWWCKAIVFTDFAKDKLSKGWKVSNSYKATEFKQGGGVYHNIPYQLEVRNGTYDHIAIVENPRYEGVMVLSPEEYKKYNQELQVKLENSKQRKGTMFNFFKKQKVETPEDFNNTYVEIKDGEEVKVADLIANYQNAMEKQEEKKKEKEEEKKMSNAEEVEIDGKKVSMKELIDVYKAEMAEVAEKDRLSKETKKDAEELKNSIENNKHFTNVKKAIEKGQDKEYKFKKYDSKKDKLERGKNY